MSATIDDRISKTRRVLRVIDAWRECDDEVRQMIDRMAAIFASNDADEQEKLMAAETVYDALFPNAPIDLESEVLDPQVEERLDREEVIFATRVREQLRAKGLTQDDLAKKIGVNQSAVSMMLNRQCRPQRRTVERIADALGVASADLLR